MLVTFEVREKYIKALEKSVNLTEFINRCLEQKYKTLTTRQLLQSNVNEIEALIDRVCDAMGTDKETVFMKSDKNRVVRKSYMVIPRHIIKYMLYNNTSLTMEQTAKLTYCDHTTVLHSIKAVQNMIATRDFQFMKIIRKGFEIRNNVLQLKTEEIEYQI